MSAEFDPQAFLELLSAVLDEKPEAVSAADRAKLNVLLREQPQARRLYRQHMELHARLHLAYTGGLAPEAMPGGVLSSPKSSAVMRSRPKWNHRVWMAAAAMLITGFGLATFFLGGEGWGTQEEKGITNEVAVLSRSLGVKWASAEMTWREGDALPPGALRITEGLAQIEFFGGASVIVEGPADLELVSRDRAVLRSGRVNALVPEPARGFVIQGPDFDAVDLGTEFALSVNASGHSEIHVLEGEVDLREQHGGALVKKLKKGEAGQMTAGAGSFELMANTSGRFVDPQELLNRSDERWKSRYTEWRNFRSRLIEDPDTAVYFDFEDQESWSRQLMNRKDGGPNAAIVGARWVAGRWPGKGALEFKRISDRVRLHVDGQGDSLTFMAWVRVDALDRLYNSLFLTDGWEQGKPHWHINNRGQLIFGIKNGGHLISKSLLGVADLGRWLHLTVTYDGASGVVCHYRDGALVSTSERLKTVRLTIGDCEIGNWQSMRNSESGVRSFNGRMDEFIISRRVLGAAEIREHYDIGNPYR